MAGGQRKPITIFAVLVLGTFFLSTMLYGSEARPLSGSRLQGNVVVRETDAGIQELFLAAAKNSGPSPGVGHRYRNFQTLGVVKEGGPSPGEGHKSSNAIDNP